MNRRTQFTGTAAGRRRERRAGLQSEASNSSEVLHRPTPSRVVLQCKRKPTDRVVKATDTGTDYYKQIIGGAAAYVEYRMNSKYQKVCNEAGRTIHAVQKRKGQSIPAYFD